MSSGDKTISITEARRRIFDIADDVQRPDVAYTLTERGKPKVVMLSATEFESLIETLEVTRILPRLVDDVREARRDIRTKKTISLNTLTKRHGVPRRTRKKGCA